MTDNIKKLIKKDPKIKNGMPVIAGTRVTVAEIIEYFEEHKFIEDVIRDLKKAGVIVTHEEVLAALEFAKIKSSDETATSKKVK